LKDALPGPATPPWPSVPQVLQSRVADDLWQMAGLPGSGPAEEVPVAFRPNPHFRRTVETVVVPEALRLKHLRPIAWKGGGAGRVVLLHDSFADVDFQSILAERAERLVAVGTYHLMEEVILRERPKLVVCQFVERTIVGIAPPPR